jgi:hypothetical protein
LTARTPEGDHAAVRFLQPGQLVDRVSPVVLDYRVDRLSLLLYLLGTFIIFEDQESPMGRLVANKP